MGKNIIQFFGELTKIIVVSLIIVIPIRFFVIQPFFVKGSSMEPSLSDREYLLVDEISYRFGEPERGDVVVFRYPRDPKQFYIKRVIALPGERVTVENSVVTVFNTENPNGFVLNEGEYLPTDEFTSGDSDVTLAPDNFFVMGDNRDASFDSRRWGALPDEFIIGRALLRIFPIAKAEAIDAPTYNLE